MLRYFIVALNQYFFNFILLDVALFTVELLIVVKVALYQCPTISCWSS